ncbi:hypothetical protein TIFTF001_011224 [Ficus carica]|uniref:WRKY domain-containing protein n=1 Tax=Ficus carica TaxID=3494 RepID=A0AA87ZZI7_FICCA|nr:hypothetical protein TIFTF001_011224 [Ficus carica]
MSSPDPPSQQTSDDSFSNPSVVAHVISLLAQDPLPSSTSERNVKFLTAVRQLSQSGTSLSSIFSQASSALQLLSETVGSIPPPAPSPSPATILSVPPLGPYAVPSITNFPAPSWSPAPPTSLSLPSLGQHFVPSISDLPLQTPWEEKVSGTEFDPWDDCNWKTFDDTTGSKINRFVYNCATPKCPMKKVVYVTYRGEHNHEEDE